MKFRIPPPTLQIDFSVSLAALRGLYLHDALAATVKQLNIPDLDRELGDLVPTVSLGALAARGLRGELMFPVPLILRANPRLLGYYRLLYGYSQQEFYTSATGAGPFQAMERRGVIAAKKRRCDYFIM